MIELRKVESPDARDALASAYFEGLAAPVDGFWQYVVLGGADFYEILADGAAAGHAAVTRGKALAQFAVDARHRAREGELFDHVLTSGIAAGASVSTKEPGFLSLCLDRQKGLEVDCFLFEAEDGAEGGSSGPAAPACPGPAAHAAIPLRAASADDLEAVRSACEPAFDGYYEELVAKGQLFVARPGGKLLGIGELRRLPTHGGAYGDLGVHVAEESRGRGVGTGIIAGLKALCAERGLRPIASCNASNLASKRALEKAGFRAAHRIVNVRFA